MDGRADPGVRCEEKRQGRSFLTCLWGVFVGWGPSVPVSDLQLHLLELRESGGRKEATSFANSRSLTLRKKSSSSREKEKQMYSSEEARKKNASERRLHKNMNKYYTWKRDRANVNSNAFEFTFCYFFSSLPSFASRFPFSAEQSSICSLVKEGKGFPLLISIMHLSFSVDAPLDAHFSLVLSSRLFR